MSLNEVKHLFHLTCCSPNLLPPSYKNNVLPPILVLLLFIGACTKGNWAGMFHLMALASVLGRPIYSVYPNVPSTVRTVIHGIVQPRISDNDIDDNTIYIMWSRDGGICNFPGAWYEPNHFIPLLKKNKKDDQTDQYKTQICKKKTQTKTPTLITSFFGPPQKKKKLFKDSGSNIDMSATTRQGEIQTEHRHITPNTCTTTINCQHNLLNNANEFSRSKYILSSFSIFTLFLQSCLFIIGQLNYILLYRVAFY